MARLLAVATGLVALAAAAGSGRAERQLVPLRATAIVAGVSDTCALTSAGSVLCWGYDAEDELGNGHKADSRGPLLVSGLASGVTAIAEGVRNACAIVHGGGVKCWGANFYGALGNGTTTRQPTPVEVSGLGGGANAVSAGSDAACAVTESGGAKCWGQNLWGALGDGTTTDRATPGNVSGLASGVTSIASAFDLRTCALTAGARVLCWGRFRLTPTAVAGLGADVKAITAECAVTAARGVKCWDDDLNAVDVPGLDHGVAALASSSTHNCALMSDGGVKCWGLNDHGQLGDGTKTNRAAPVDVVGLPGAAVAIATGGFHTCAALKSGGVDCWGSNLAGQLGNGTNIDHSRPVAVMAFGVVVPTVAIASRSIHVTRARVASVGLRCSTGVRCFGSVKLVVGSVSLGARRFSLSSGTGSVPVKLSASGFARLVRSKRLAARVTVTGAATAARTVTLVAP